MALVNGLEKLNQRQDKKSEPIGSDFFICSSIFMFAFRLSKCALILPLRFCEKEKVVD